MKLKIALLNLMIAHFAFSTQEGKFSVESLTPEQYRKHVRVNEDMQKAIYSNDIEAINKIVKENPYLINSHRNDYVGFAVAANQKNVIELLIKLGFPVNIKGYKRRTPLMLAAERADIDIILLLLANGADINARDDKNRTALDYAKQSKSPKKNEAINLLQLKKEKLK